MKSLNVQYEIYNNDYDKSYCEEKFSTLEEFKKWIFSSTRRKYEGYTFSFPQNEPRRITILTGNVLARMIFIHEVLSGDKIIFSDGKYTNGETFWTNEMKYFFNECEKYRKSPKFNFAKGNYSIEEEME